MKRILLAAALGLATISAGCKDPITVGIDLALADINDFSGIFQASDGMIVEVNDGDAIIRQKGSTQYSFGTPQVGSKFMIGMSKVSPGVYRGYIMEKDGLLAATKTVTMTENGMIVETDVAAATNMNRQTTKTGGSFAGGWHRVSDTYDTDIQIGVPGEGPSRIYLCTLAPTEQLVKGHVMSDGVTIKWDREYNVPDYQLQSQGNGMQLYVPSLQSIGGTYERANWRSGSCGLSY